MDEIEDKILIDASPVKPVSEWQPIETAPKDGQWFLVFSAIRGVRMYRYWGAGEFGNESGNELPLCTHWMPLPESPK